MNRQLANDAAAAVATVCVALLAGAATYPAVGAGAYAIAAVVWLALACGWAAMRERGR